jgi:cell division transport system permease protein
MSKTHNISHKNSFWNMHLTTILSLSMVLFLVGLVSLFYFLANDMSNHMRENMTLSIILTDSIDNSGEKRIETLLIENAYAKHIKYISKEDA